MKCCVSLALLLLSVPGLHAENWPHWRGPAYNGSSPETGLPEKFSRNDDGKGENLLWTAALPGGGVSTPIIWNERVFVTSTDRTSGDLWALCFERESGKTLWKKKLATIDLKKPVSNTGKSSLASPSAVTDGQTVWFTFGNGDLVALDFQGNELWRKNLEKEYGTLSFLHGYGSSPLLYKNKLYVLMLRNPDETAGGKLANATTGKRMDSFLAAFDPASGKQLWKVDRTTDAKDGAEEAYSSPIPWENGNRSEIVVAGADYVTGSDPETGKEIWRWGTLTPVKAQNKRIVSSPVTTPDLIYASGPNRRPTFAIRTGGAGPIATDFTAWQFTEFPNSVPTPVLYNGALYILDGQQKRMMTSLNPKTGAKNWGGPLGGPIDFDASPTAADGKLYCINEVGTVMILDAAQFKVLCSVPLDEAHCAASIAIAHKRLFIRTGKNLYCVGK